MNNINHLRQFRHAITSKITSIGRRERRICDIDGMEGEMVKDPESLFKGKRMKNGWKNSGLPWTYKINPEKMKLPVDS